MPGKGHLAGAQLRQSLSITRRHRQTPFGVKIDVRRALEHD
ncbi:hypothetical protein HMPREF9439_02367 [Parasutterella excrementihominis YIT 11859]|uniref:Uncharacterized protein n=1 Tax=Parasutterella excrementihominis YIT 11859 TaxID=762966 RepID=F3QN38_9BURK|nr:hypothetical protein HMPREF9439_02367 [Parasutterella excrementihominis YIT 11859]